MQQRIIEDYEVKIKDHETGYWFMNSLLSHRFILKIKELKIKNLYGHIENHIAILNRPPTKEENKLIFGDK